jgi:hypothetical protein
MNPFAFTLLFAAFIGFIVWLVRKNQQLLRERDLKFSIGAHDTGWRYAPNPEYSGVIVRGQVRNEAQDVAFTFDGHCDAFDWCMWYDNGRRFASDSSSSGPSTVSTAVWRCESLHADQLQMLILPRGQYRVESGRIFGAVAAFASSFAAAVTGTDGHDSHQAFFKRAVELKGTLAGFDNAFAVLIGPGASQAWLDEKLQSMLLQWPKGCTPSPAHSVGFGLAVSYGADGLQMTFRQPLSDSWPFWEQFGRLGQELGLRLART